MLGDEDLVNWKSPQIKAMLALTKLLKILDLFSSWWGHPAYK